MAISEGTQKIYKLHKAKDTEFGLRVMTEVGVVKNLEKDKVKNYVLLPFRVKDKKGKGVTTSWEIHEIVDPKDELDILKFINMDRINR